MNSINEIARSYRREFGIPLPRDVSPGRYFIYALVDPFLREVRYVGRSYAPHLRWYSHASFGSAASQALRSWITTLRDHGVVPELVILERPHWWTDSTKRESAWIRKLANQGEPLLNIRDNPAAVEELVEAGRLRRKA